MPRKARTQSVSSSHSLTGGSIIRLSETVHMCEGGRGGRGDNGGKGGEGDEIARRGGESG